MGFRLEWNLRWHSELAAYLSDSYTHISVQRWCQDPLPHLLIFRAQTYSFNNCSIFLSKCSSSCEKKWMRIKHHCAQGSSCETVISAYCDEPWGWALAIWGREGEKRVALYKATSIVDSYICSTYVHFHAWWDSISRWKTSLANANWLVSSSQLDFSCWRVDVWHKKKMLQ